MASDTLGSETIGKVDGDVSTIDGDKKKVTLPGFRYYEADLNEEGSWVDAAKKAAFEAHVQTSKFGELTDLFVMIHGMGNTPSEARSIYNTYYSHMAIAAAEMQADTSTMAVCGIIWPSGGGAHYVSEGVVAIVKDTASSFLRAFGWDQGAAVIDAAPISPLIQRAMKVATAGVTPLIDLMTGANPTLRIHIVAHSMGTVVGGWSFPLVARPVESVFLIQGALLSNAFSTEHSLVKGTLKNVRGHIVATTSSHDQIFNTASYFTPGKRLANDGFTEVNARTLDVREVTHETVAGSKFININCDSVISNHDDYKKWEVVSAHWSCIGSKTIWPLSPPSLADQGDQVMVVHRHADQGMYSTLLNRDGTVAEATTRISAWTTLSRPALVMLSGVPTLVFRGTDHQLYLAQRKNGSWGHSERIEGAASYGPPSLVENNGTLTLAYRNIEGRICCRTRPAGSTTWGAEKALEYVWHEAPALAVANGTVYLAMRALDNRFYWTTVDGTGTAAPKKQVPFLLGFSTPSMAGFDGKLYFANTTQDNHILCTTLDPNTNIVTPAFKNTNAWLTRRSPVLASVGGKLHLLHWGINGKIYDATLTGDGFSPATVLKLE